MEPINTKQETAATELPSEAEIEAHDVKAYMTELKRCGALPVETNGTEALPNFPASAPLDTNDYDPAGFGRANTTGWPRHALPYEIVYAKRKR